MKPAAAFSIGLWAGAAVIAAVGLFYVQGTQRSQGGATSATASELAAKADEMRALEQENARLNAEVQRLKETTSSLKSNLAEKVTVEDGRRIPFVVPPTAVEPVPTTAEAENWMEQAVASGDVTALPQLEKLALSNNRRALEAVALLADRDQAATLTRVWRSGSLTMPRLVDATRYLAATIEVNPDAEQLLRGLATDPSADPRVLYAVVDGLKNPNIAVDLGQEPAVSAPPHFKPDFGSRIRMLDILRTLFTDADLRGYVDQAKAELQTR
jgi:hypothetical protein